MLDFILILIVGLPFILGTVILTALRSSTFLLPFGSGCALRHDHEMIARGLSIICLLSVLLFLSAVLSGN
ncbi:MAG TPA: hypothetical protein DCX53_07185 [Anaerolineae bacterium]|nr:hypothetical protein [Anaerolineae bacterium]